METTLSKLYLLCNFSNSDQYLKDYAKCLDYSRTYVLFCQKRIVSIGLQYVYVLISDSAAAAAAAAVAAAAVAAAETTTKISKINEEQ